jgi:tetratricopeptide (TPR) repeat protein
MPDCEHLARTTAYFDGALAPADEAEATTHLATCVHCQRVLGDAVAIDAALSTPAQARTKRRWPLVVGIAGVLAAAAIAFTVRPKPETTQVAIELPAERAIEARFASGEFARHRPLAVLRGDQVRENISLAALATLEQRGAKPDLAAALAASGDLARAREVAAALPATAAGDSDRAAIELAAREPERALEHASRAVARDPSLTAAWWNLGLAARALGLPRVARAAFEKASDGAWAAESTAQIAALDRDLAPELAFAAFDRRARAMVAGEAPITVDDVRAFPAFARVYVLDALRVAPIDPLRPLAAELDAQSGTATMRAAVDRAAKTPPALREKFADRYRAVVARTASPEDVTQLVADLRAAGPTADDLLVGTIITGGQTAAHLPLLREKVATWRDAWFDMVIERADIKARFQPGDLRAQPAYAAALKACPAWATLRCGQLAQDLAQLVFDSGRARDAEPWARRAMDAYRAALSPTHLHTARSLLADIHRHLDRTALARAELDEIILAKPSCPLERFARVIRADLAFVAGDWAGVRATLPPPVPPAGCKLPSELQPLSTAVDLARRTNDAADRTRAHEWIEAASQTEGEHVVRISSARLGDAAALAALGKWVAQAPADAPRAQALRAWAFSTLIAHAGERRDWTGALALAQREQPNMTLPACTVLASVDDAALTVVARTPSGELGEHRLVEAGTFDTTTIIPASITNALSTCEGIALVARPPLHGRADLLPPGLPWWFASDAPTRAPSGTARALEVTSPLPPELDLPPLAPPTPSVHAFADKLAGREATPSRVLAALATATYAELHAHGIVSAHDDDAAYLALSPEPDGTFALRADAVRAAKLANAPIVVLGACRAAAVAPSLRERWSLPDAFVAAGASAVVAAGVPIPDASARRVFDDLHRRILAGEPVERALAAIRAAATGETAWARQLVLFR